MLQGERGRAELLLHVMLLDQAELFKQRRLQHGQDRVISRLGVRGFGHSGGICDRPLLVGISALLILTGCETRIDAHVPVVEVESSRIQRFDTDSLLYDIVSVLPDESGVWALSAQAPYLYRFDSGGRLRDSFGTRGRGPGELSFPSGLLQHPASAMLEVWDPGSHAIHRFSRDGAHQQTVGISFSGAAVRSDMREISYGVANKVRRFGSGYVLQVEPGGATQTRDFSHSLLVLIDSAGTPGDTLVDFRGPAEGAFRETAYALVSIPLWEVCGRDRLVVFSPVARRLVWFETSGHRMDSVTVDLPSRRLTSEDILFHMRHVLRGELRGQDVDSRTLEQLASRIVRDKREFFPEKTPPAVDLVCDDRGRPWLNLFSTRDDPIGFSPEWQVVDRRPRRIRFPLGFHVYQLGAARAYGTVRDADGVERVAAISIPDA